MQSFIERPHRTNDKGIAWCESPDNSVYRGSDSNRPRSILEISHSRPAVQPRETSAASSGAIAVDWSSPVSVGG